ncbi:phage capsid protein [Neorhizobium sp. IRAMC:178]|uniref:phage capsid protein n=1 Tax=Neorhizobium tunisiense TaxID=3144793 RepID=UPI0031F672BC
MAYPITKDQFVEEWVVAFQRGETYLKESVTTEEVLSGLTAKFALQAAAGRMTSRGTNGLIPSRNRTDTQPTVTLEEKHSKETRTGFDVFTAPANVREAMQNAGANAAAREIDYTIIDALATATNQYNSGSAITLTYGKTVDALSELFEADVMVGNQITCLWTPKAWARLLTFQEFKSADYVDEKVLVGMTLDRPKIWLGAKHIMHNGLPGKGTATASNFIFAKPAVGHAIAQDNIQVGVGYNDEDDYSFSRHTIFDGATILQQAGVIEVVTDDTAAFS